MYDDIAAFLRARLDEDEAAANAATWHERAAVWRVVDRGELNPLTKKPRTLHDVRYVLVDSLDDCVTEIDAQASDDDGIAGHIARHDPARVLREVAAKRAILAEHLHVKTSGSPGFGCRICHQDRDYGIYGEGWCGTIRPVAAVFSDHPDYRPEWSPDAD